jgi:hypothetical protein
MASHRSRRTARPGLLAVCAVALVATAGIRVAGGDEDPGPGGAVVDVAPTEVPDVRPVGVDPDGAPDRNPFGTPGGPATVATDPVTGEPVPADGGDGTAEGAVPTDDTVGAPADGTDVAAFVAPAG